MALSPVNPTQLTPPRVAFIDERSGAISREWYRFFLSLLTATQTNQDEVELAPDATSLLATYDAMLAELAQATESAPDCCVSGEAVLASDIQGLASTPLGASVSALAAVQSDIESLALAPPGNSGTVTSVTGTAPVVSSGGTNPAISMPAATTTVDGYLTSADWNTFNSKGSGSVTSVSVVSANGLAGTVATSTTTPAITLTTTITGILKGNGTAISAATADVDYIAPSAPVTKTADFTVAVSETWIINNKSGSTCTVTLPSAATYSGRYLTFQNNQAQTLVSASSDVVPQGGGAAGTAILTDVSGNWATLVSNGTNWVIMQAASFNNLLY
jgi:hypothetical protein